MKNKGYTLAEMVAVIAILMFLAMLSTPFVKGYIDDAYNGKAQIFMRQLNEARQNFEKDYPGTTVSGDVDTAGGAECDIESIYGQTDLSIPPAYLIACKYLHFPADLEGRYKFTFDSKKCEVCTAGAAVVMIGEEDAGIYSGKCACIDSFGRLYKQDTD